MIHEPTQYPNGFGFGSHDCTGPCARRISPHHPASNRKTFGGGRHIVDAIAEKNDQKYLISLKWQQTGGTAEQKVPFEVISLAEVVLDGGFAKAYLVLGGEGWTLRNFYTGGGLKKHLWHADKVEIVTLENFVARANNGEL